MMPLGTRVVPEDTTLEHRIETALTKAVEVADRANMSPGPDVPYGLAVTVGEGGEALLVLSIRDASRIAAAAARGWF